MPNKAYLKYAGGKSRILDSVLKTIYGDSEKIGTFIEPFTGSATVALNVDADIKILNDYNSDVICCHRMCYDRPGEVLSILESLYEIGRDGYYDLRDEFNNSYPIPTERRAALFIYFNKHGFNGMVRYNSHGKFNIPVGKSNTIHFPHDEIKDFRKNLGNAEFTCLDFSKSFEMAERGSVIYCDPPYVPASVTLSDIKYTADGFSREDQERLVYEAEKASNKGCKVIISNHDTPVTRDLYKNASEIIEVSAFRSISRNGGDRGPVKELIAIY